MKKTKRVLSILLVFAMMFAFTAQAFAAVSLPSISSSKSITCYTLNSSGSVYAYKAKDLKTKTGGYITCSTDECKILQISGNAVQVKYPVSGGTKTAWFARSAFTSYNISGGAASKWTQANKITTYRRSDGKNSFGSISAGDLCYKLTAKGNYTQCIYPISGGYKMGWVKTSEIKEKTTSTTSTEQQVLNKITTMQKSGTYKLNTTYTGPYSSEQCKGFAKSVHNVLFGYIIGSTCSKPNNYKINYNSSNTKVVGSVSSLTTTNVKNLFSTARAGDFVQMRRTHGGSHSAIVVSVSSSGVTWYECNTDGKNTITKNTYTWAQLCNKNVAMSVYTAKNYKLK